MSVAIINGGVLVSTNSPLFIGSYAKSSVQDVAERFLGMSRQVKWTKEVAKQLKKVAYLLQRAMQYGGDLELFRHNGGFEGAVVFEDVRDLMKFKGVASSEIAGYVLRVSIDLPQNTIGTSRTASEARAWFDTLSRITKNSEGRLQMKRVTCMFGCAEENHAKLEKMVQLKNSKLKTVLSFEKLEDKEKFERTIEELLQNI